jgi:predicted DNA-binding WGR domain protein
VASNLKREKTETTSKPEAATVVEKKTVAKEVIAPAESNSDLSAKRYFEFCEDGSHKFWEISVSGAALTTRWGKVGTDGQCKTKDFVSDEKAEAEAAKLIVEKTKKGYQEQ